MPSSAQSIADIKLDDLPMSAQSIAEIASFPNPSPQQVTGTKACDVCSKDAHEMTRCRIDATKEWKLVCNECWKDVSGGVVDGDAEHPHYVYGGVWKGKKNRKGNPRKPKKACAGYSWERDGAKIMVKVARWRWDSQSGIRDKPAGQWVALFKDVPIPYTNAKSGEVCCWISPPSGVSCPLRQMVPRLTDCPMPTLLQKKRQRVHVSIACSTRPFLVR